MDKFDNKYTNYDKRIFFNKGIIGLSNEGNTCYINSILQCLLHSYEFTYFLSQHNNWKDKIKKNTPFDTLILLELHNLFKLVWKNGHFNNDVRNKRISNTQSIQPIKFLDIFYKCAFKKGMVEFADLRQNDTSEFLSFIIQSCHNSLSRNINFSIVKQNNKLTNIDELALKTYETFKNMHSNDWSEILPIFYGMEVTKVESLESDYINYTPMPFFNLTLEVVNNDTLYKCLDSYTSCEELNNDNKLFIDKNNRHELIKRSINFWNLPSVLIITLKRFNNNNQKINKYIDIPHILNMNKYIIGYNTKNDTCFELYAICNHMGGTRGGHYTANIKHANDIWFNCNDTHIHQIDNKNVITPYAYCLFYRKLK